MILSIQYLRALAALLVLVHHVAGKTQQFITNTPSDFAIGNMGVDLFFIISGFIMCLVGKNMTVSSFIVARCIRILPLYWLLTSLALFIFMIWPDRVNASGGTTSVLGSYTLIPIWGKFLLQNGWTLSYEFAFYVFFSLALLSRATWRLLIAAGLLILAVASSSWLRIPVFNDTMMLEFLLGMGVYAMRPRKGGSTSAGILLIVTGLAYLVLSFDFSPYRERFAIAGVSCALIVAGMLYLESWLQSWRSTRIGSVLLSLGDSSYSLYLSHPFTLVAGVIFLRVLPFPVGAWPATIMLIVLAVVTGHLCYRLIEKPLDQKIRRHLVRKPHKT